MLMFGLIAKEYWCRLKYCYIPTVWCRLIEYEKKIKKLKENMKIYELSCKQFWKNKHFIPLDLQILMCKIFKNCILHFWIGGRSSSVKTPENLYLHIQIGLSVSVKNLEKNVRSSIRC